LEQPDSRLHVLCITDSKRLILGPRKDLQTEAQAVSEVTILSSSTFCNRFPFSRRTYWV